MNPIETNPGNSSVKKEIKETKDGSHTLFVPELNEHYHSMHGAIQESSHVFIKEGFHKCTKDIIYLFEAGFGTGLNAILTFIEAEKNKKKVFYQGIDHCPLDWNLVRKLNYPDLLPENIRETFKEMHQSKWNVTNMLSPWFTFRKIKADLRTYNPAPGLDLVYFDAFGPDKQPEMWSYDIFFRIFEAMNRGGILTTYSVKGSVKRMLKDIGYEVDLIKGPPGKRQMIRAMKKYEVRSMKQEVRSMK